MSNHQQKKVCKYYMNGFCKKKDSCDMLHINLPNKSASPTNSSATNHNKKKDNKKKKMANYFEGKQSHSPTSHSSSSSPSNSNKKPIKIEIIKDSPNRKYSFQSSSNNKDSPKKGFTKATYPR